MISPITEGYDVLLTRWDANGTLPLCFPPQSNGHSQDELKETQQVNVMGYAWCGGGGGYPSTSAGKESACSAGDPGLIPGLGRSPGEGIGYPLQYSCLENPHGQRYLVGYGPK